MGAWVTEQLCDPCWVAADGGEPYRLVEEYRETTPCTDCGQPTASGIYVRREVFGRD